MIQQVIDACKKSECNIIVGAGACGKKLWGIMQQSDIPIVCFCDNHAKANQTVYDHEVLVPQKVVDIYPNALYIIAIMKYRAEVLEQLIQLGIPENHILHFYSDRTYEYYSSISEEQYPEELEDLYYLLMGQKLDLQNPQKFTEKIQWLKAYDRNPMKSVLADKYAARDYIKNKIGEEHLIPLLGVWNHFEEIDFNKLPDEFVLKCNHASGANIIVRQKDKMNKHELKHELEKWLDINYAFMYLEFHYRDINPKIIAEKYIEEADGNLFDYKVHCFHGEPMYIQVIGDRDLRKHLGLQMVYDFDWNEQPWAVGGYPKYKRKLKRPPELEQLYQLSKVLCEEFVYVRIDFYIVSGRILFGEMTFTPGAGFYQYNEDWEPEMDLSLGEKIRLP